MGVQPDGERVEVERHITEHLRFGVAFGLAAGDGGGLRLTTGTADAGRTTTAGGSSLRACSLRVLLETVEWCTRRTALAAA